MFYDYLSYSCYYYHYYQLIIILCFTIYSLIRFCYSIFLGKSSIPCNDANAEKNKLAYEEDVATLSYIYCDSC
ncbi:hypothetical protein PIB30_117399 [Stylosanthes scabra]|uniref:Uncharacterized protein n=1 Tax=Stylosanthes scabra TaxID=79078 RepID=A0ABU6VU42_9FABA|nr:hypothetical protein [Stylosanthes scabra]